MKAKPERASGVQSEASTKEVNRILSNNTKGLNIATGRTKATRFTGAR